MISQYRNSFFDEHHGYDPEIYRTEAEPIEYRGHQLFHRLPGRCCDVVKDGVCIAQRVSVRGAKGWVDLLCDDPEATSWRTNKQ